MFPLLTLAFPPVRRAKVRIAAIVSLYAVAISIFVIYIQSIGSGIGIFSGLFISSLVPIKPSEGKPSRCLTKLERQQFTIPENLPEILIGLIMGDLKIERPILNGN